MHSSFEWDEEKNKINIQKHNVNFYEAQKAFLDINRIILEDIDHSIIEKRYFCLGKVEDGILTVRFMFQDNHIRIFGAGYWRKGKRIYEQENKIY
ncbi:BrnT family toxin [Rickettsia endosymbiont of Halotydeus destructor]|uniref:BrnT family toxin n=1 Tax=Rickettsia endosymbiont of Halotydeus destructor TaxID=2996754 RepID=UPI003BAE6A3B